MSSVLVNRVGESKNHSQLTSTNPPMNGSLLIAKFAIYTDNYFVIRIQSVSFLKEPSGWTWTK